MSSTSTPHPLHRAIADGDVAVVTSLIADGVDPDTVDGATGRSPLMTACEFDRPEIVETLLSAGASVNWVDPDGATALHHAVDLECDAQNQAGVPVDFRLIGPLLAAGAVSGPLHRGLTARGLAAAYGHEEVVERIPDPPGQRG